MTSSPRGEQWVRRCGIAVAAAILWAAGPGVRAADAGSESFSNYQRELAGEMLKGVCATLREKHFDANLKGLKLDELQAKAQAQIDQASSHGETFRAIAGVTRAFEDSHTQFLPPRWGFTADYGWQAMAVGKSCVIYDVASDGPAAGAGVRRGDRLLAIEGRPVEPGALRSWNYLLHHIEPFSQLVLTLAAPDGKTREVTVTTKFTPRQANLDLQRDFATLVRNAEAAARERRSTLHVFGDVLVWRLPSFRGEREDIDRAFREMARTEKLILDLRGNGGGAEGTLLRLIATLFGADTPVGLRRGRDGAVPVVAELRREKPWSGKLFVILDSRSASASEVLAALVQAKGRGFIFGDRSAGHVQRSELVVRKVGSSKVVVYGVEVATSELELEGGKKLEGVGVTPDFLKLPSPEDIALDRDPVLALALKQFGVAADPAELGKQARADDEAKR